MVPPKVLVLGHSFVRRLQSDLKQKRDLRLCSTFKLKGTARVFLHGVGGRTVEKMRKLDLRVILKIGSNELSSSTPGVVGSRIDNLVALLLDQYRVKVVGVCLITPRENTRPSVTPFLPNGVHFNRIGQYNLYRSYRWAILKAIKMLPWVNACTISNLDV